MNWGCCYFPSECSGCCFCMSQKSTALCSFAIVSYLDQSHHTIWQSSSVTNEASNSRLKVCKLKCGLQSVVRVWDWKAFTAIPSANGISHACTSCLYADIIYEDTWIYACIQAGESTYQRRRHRFDPWVGKIPWEGNGISLQYSCLENAMDRGACQATVPGVAESDMT